MPALFQLMLGGMYAEMTAALEHGNSARLAELLAEVRERWPVASNFVDSVFTGTPEEVLRKASGYWPALREMPGALGFVGEVQRRLHEEVSKKRPGL